MCVLLVKLLKVKASEPIRSVFSELWNLGFGLLIQFRFCNGTLQVCLYTSFFQKRNLCCIVNRGMTVAVKL